MNRLLHLCIILVVITPCSSVSLNAQSFRAAHTSATLSDSFSVAWIGDYTSALVSPSDNAKDVATDAQGNIYITGESDNDYLTIKYDSMGVQQWFAVYNGPANSSDNAIDLTVDASGNVYVTGNSYGTSYDIATVKYDASGVQQWVARYNGPGNNTDYVYDLTVDASGNVYVTGASVDSATSYDYATVKYDSSGVQQWVARYNGPGNSQDWGGAVVLDASGNVYVTGWSVGASTSEDYATVKYNGLGVQQWATRYNGPGNSSDKATDIVLDSFGNVYVTGASEGASSSDDYATIRYNASGTQVWVTRYNGPVNSTDGAVAIVLDAPAALYVTGRSIGSGSEYDYATVKYDALLGFQQWAARYNGPGNDDDEATDIALDASGNPYVTGKSVGAGTFYDYATVKYNTSGAQQWVGRYDGPVGASDQGVAIAIGATGNVHVTGASPGSGTNGDCATVKYNASGLQQWVSRYDGPANSSDGMSEIAIDAAGNSYVTGSSFSSVTSNDYETIKYDASGVQQWVVRYNGPGNSDDVAMGLAIDTAGNVYVTGHSAGSGTFNDYATVKYDAAGVQQWVARYNGPGNSQDQASAIVLDDLGNVYVTGRSVGSGTSNDYATVKYDASGVQQWVVRYNDPENSDDAATALTIDHLGNVYVTGWSNGAGTSQDYATVKYDASGVQQWANRYDGLGNSNDVATGIALDASGNVHVTGMSTGASPDYATVKYDASGVQQWVTRYDSPQEHLDEASAIAVDALGNVYVTGASVGAGGFEDYATVKYDASGVQQWVARYDGPGGSVDFAHAIALDALGNVYVTGQSNGFLHPSVTPADYATVRYNVSGVQQWVARHSGSGNSFDYAYAIGLDAARSVYVTGRAAFEDGHQATTIKYNQKGESGFSPSYSGLSFGTILVGTSRTDSVTISNPGELSLDISSITSTIGDFNPGVSGIVVPPGGNAVVQVSFTPTTSGAKNGSLVFIHDALGSPDTISLDGIAEDQASVSAGWNLLSVPVSRTDYLKQSIYPSALSQAYTFSGSTGYQQRDTLANGEGYWLKFSGAESLTIPGSMIVVDSFQVQAGWNLVGSISKRTATSSIVPQGTSILTPFYEYSGSYASADTLKPGLGYWVKVSQPGVLILGLPSAPSKGTTHTTKRSEPVVPGKSQVSKKTQATTTDH